MGVVSLVAGLLVLFQTPEMPKVIQGAQWEGMARSVVPGVSQGPMLVTCGAVIGPTQSQLSQSIFHGAISY